MLARFSKSLVFALGLAMIAWPSLGLAQTGSGVRSYFYDSIDVEIKVFADSSFEVIERQGFNYTGEYHKGFRSIPLNKVSDIRDVAVYDGRTGQQLIYSSGPLPKDEPSSWGKYTAYQQGGKQYIEWYYDARDETKLWALKYKVYGGLAFEKDHDRLYWNIFTDYDVPVKNSTVTISLPRQITPADARVYAYRSSNAPINKVFDDKRQFFSFWGTKFAPREAFTIDIGWPKGLVQQSSFWLFWVQRYWGYILAALIVFASLVTALVYWLKTEVWVKGRAAIVPQYEPPQKLKPAMAEVLLKEKVTSRGLSATIIDLAIRGYVKIEEVPPTALEKFGSVFVRVIFFVVIFLTLAMAFGLSGIIKDVGLTPIRAFNLLIVALVAVIIIFRTSKKMGGLIPKNYKVVKVKDFAEDAALEDYEKIYLSILFTGGKSYFSTSEMKHASKSKKNDMYHKIQTLKEVVAMETAKDTGVYDVDFSREHKRNAVVGVAIFIGIFAIWILSAIRQLPWVFSMFFGSQIVVFVAAIVVCGAGLYMFIKYEARLSHEGRLLRDDWKGFKLFMSVAERYRMQNLKPEMFEKYLPYALIFGLEKQWSKAFQGMDVASPSWYAGMAYAGGAGHGGGSGSVGGFSPAAFSASFASAFSSAMSSSGGGGAGGGSAGGGGGGGGGGAS